MEQDLQSAVLSHDLAEVDRILATGVDVDGVDSAEPYASTALYLAATAGDAAMVRRLLRAGADPNLVSPGEADGLPLCGAACWGHDEALQVLLDCGADPDKTEDGEWTALLWAASTGQQMCAELLLGAGANPDTRHSYASALGCAARHGAYGIAAALLAHGADAALTGSGPDGPPPLELAREWLAADPVVRLREQVSEFLPPGTVVTTAIERAPDETRIIRVEDAEGSGDEVQDGHAAIVTLLERALGISAPPAELIQRARSALSADHPAYAEAVTELRARSDLETFELARDLCGAANPRDRMLGADVLSELGYAENYPHRDQALPLLQALAAGEQDEDVLTSALRGLGILGADPADLLRHLGHESAQVRLAVAVALGAVIGPGNTAAVSALIALTRDQETRVRDWAVLSLAGLEADTAQIRDALAERLDDTDLDVVAEAVRGLADRDDPRAQAGVHRILTDPAASPYAVDLATTHTRNP